MITNYKMLTEEQVRGYLDRLCIDTPIHELKPEKEVLDRLIAAHHRYIPFENLLVYCEQKVPSLELEDLYDKIVVRKRGGYCFEMNGLFIALLQSLGFDAWSCMCRVIRGGAEIRPVAHRGNIINFDGVLHFCDVGFGGPMPCEAVALKAGEVQQVGSDVYRMTDEGHGWWGIWRQQSVENDDPENAGSWMLELLFMEALADPVDFEPLNAAVSAPPTGVFSQIIMVNQRTETGYRAITGLEYTVKENGVTTKRQLADEAQARALLADEFGLL